MISAHEIEIKTFCHATEDCAKVMKALLNIIPPDLRREYSVVKQVVHGYYGNPITIYTLRIREGLASVIDYIANKLDSSDKAILSATLDLRYDRRANKLYLRFSKQDAYLNKIILSDSDDIIKVTISFKNARGINRVREYLKNMGMIT
ncbi:MAG: RNA-binding domain-containing protein [Thermoprotei archaeon]